MLSERPEIENLAVFLSPTKKLAGTLAKAGDQFRPSHSTRNFRVTEGAATLPNVKKITQGIVENDSCQTEEAKAQSPPQHMDDAVRT